MTGESGRAGTLLGVTCVMGYPYQIIEADPWEYMPVDAIVLHRSHTITVRFGLDYHSLGLAVAEAKRLIHRDLVAAGYPARQPGAWVA